MSDSRSLDETFTKPAPAALADADRRDLLTALAGLHGDELVDWVRADQRRRWEHGERLLIEAYLELPPVAAAGEDAAVDLIYSEFILRESLGEPADLDSFARRFPARAAHLGQLHALDEAFDLGKLSDALDHDGKTEIPAFPEQPPSVVPGQLFAGKYPVTGLLGEGGQAVVFRAAHPALAREVVIKWSKSKAGDPADRERFLAEGRVLAGLEHPHLARVYDLDLCADRPYLVMEHVAGQNLEQYFGRQALTPRQKAALVAKVARALGVAHRRGVLHQDVKPKNVVVDEKGEPRLIDFGLARSRTAFREDAPEPDATSGTIAYMAPEQARGELSALGPRSDVFGLGGVLYYLLAARSPYRDVTAAHALERARRGDWDRTPLAAPSVPRPLRSICTRALAPDPQDRFASADELASRLEAYVRRPKVLAGAALAAALLLLIAGLTWAFVASRPAPVVETKPAVLAWEVRRGEGKSFDTVNVFPLLDGDRLRLRATFPHPVRASVFWFSDGELKQESSPEDDAPSDHLVFPAKGEAILGGKPGTEFVLICGRRDAPVTLAELQSLWGPLDPWPDLAPETVFALDRTAVRKLQTGRPIVGFDAKADPAGVVRDRLEALRTRLAGRLDVYCGLAFARVEE